MPNGLPQVEDVTLGLNLPMEQIFRVLEMKFSVKVLDILVEKILLRMGTDKIWQDYALLLKVSRKIMMESNS
ncbi:uncharacterized protein METZ01_LOCUS321057 [marine metagenome]|uniref:Uncharacterized protein n=1 Tax=marine metagenome TaxID=408172 RepID=A0A382P4B8_9ZZZZ